MLDCDKGPEISAIGIKTFWRKNMSIAGDSKEKVKQEIAAVLSGFSEVRRVVIFGSFVTSDNPHDLDIAVFQDSDEGYYPLARKYRRTLRNVARIIPLDVISVPNANGSPAGYGAFRACDAFTDTLRMLFLSVSSVLL